MHTRVMKFDPQALASRPAEVDSCGAFFFFFFSSITSRAPLLRPLYPLVEAKDPVMPSGTSLATASGAAQVARPNLCPGSGERDASKAMRANARDGPPNSIHSSPITRRQSRWWVNVSPGAVMTNRFTVNSLFTPCRTKLDCWKTYIGGITLCFRYSFVPGIAGLIQTICSKETYFGGTRELFETRRPLILSFYRLVMHTWSSQAICRERATRSCHQRGSARSQGDFGSRSNVGGAYVGIFDGALRRYSLEQRHPPPHPATPEATRNEAIQYRGEGREDSHGTVAYLASNKSREKEQVRSQRSETNALDSPAGSHSARSAGKNISSRASHGTRRDSQRLDKDLGHHPSVQDGDLAKARGHDSPTTPQGSAVGPKSPAMAYPVGPTTDCGLSSDTLASDSQDCGDDSRNIAGVSFRACCAGVGDRWSLAKSKGVGSLAKQWLVFAYGHCLLAGSGTLPTVGIARDGGGSGARNDRSAGSITNMGERPSRNPYRDALEVFADGLRRFPHSTGILYGSSLALQVRRLRLRPGIGSSVVSRRPE